MSKIHWPAAAVLGGTVALTLGAIALHADALVVTLMPLCGAVVQAFMRSLTDGGAS